MIHANGVFQFNYGNNLQIFSIGFQSQQLLMIKYFVCMVDYHQN